MENPSSALFSSGDIDAALSCPALARARKLAGWVGQGKTLTASGVLRPAEAVQACRDLGIELPGPRVRSALDVEDLMRDWVTAAAAGFLEMGGRRVRAAQDLPEAGSSTHPDPDAILHAWVQAATVVLDLGEEPCAVCLTVLHELYSADGPLTIDQLATAVRAALEPEEPEEPEALPCPGCGEVHGPGDLLGLGDVLGDEDEDEEDAASHAAATVTGLLRFAAADVADEAVRLTPLGTVLAASVFQGREPSPDADAATVMYGQQRAAAAGGLDRGPAVHSATRRLVPFEIGPAQPVTAGRTSRLPVTAVVAATVWDRGRWVHAGS